jgi:hypothetical protein
MKIMFLLFLTVNGVPNAQTQRFEANDRTCRLELAMVKGLNDWNQANSTGVWAYGSCEPVSKPG